MNDQDVLDRIVKVATETTLQFLEKEKQRQQKAKKDWRLRNTKLLLKNYRTFVEHSEEAKTFLLQDPDVLDELYTEEFAVEAIKRSKKRTLTMVRFMQQMLLQFQIMCERSGQDEDMRRYKIVHAMYVSDEILTVEQIAECHKIDTRTVYRDINDASKTLSVLIFGVDGLRLE